MWDKRPAVFRTGAFIIIDKDGYQSAALNEGNGLEGGYARRTPRCPPGRAQAPAPALAEEHRHRVKAQAEESPQVEHVSPQTHFPLPLETLFVLARVDIHK